MIFGAVLCRSLCAALTASDWVWAVGAASWEWPSRSILPTTLRVEWAHEVRCQNRRSDAVSAELGSTRSISEQVIVFWMWFMVGVTSVGRQALSAIIE